MVYVSTLPSPISPTTIRIKNNYPDGSCALTVTNEVYVPLAVNLHASLRAAANLFGIEIDSLLNTVLAKFDAADRDPVNADSYISAAISYYYTQIDIIVKKATDSVQRAVTESNSRITSTFGSVQCEIIDFSLASSWFNKYLTDSINTVLGDINRVTADYNNRFSFRISSSGSSTFNTRLKTYYDNYMSLVSSAESEAINSIQNAYNSFVSTVAGLEYTPENAKKVSNSVSVFNDTLSSITTLYNSKLSSAYSQFGSSLSSIKYYGDSFGFQLSGPVIGSGPGSALGSIGTFSGLRLGASLSGVETGTPSESSSSSPVYPSASIDTQVNSVYAAVNLRYNDSVKSVGNLIDSLTKSVSDRVFSFFSVVSSSQINSMLTAAKAELSQSVSQFESSLSSIVSDAVSHLDSVESIIVNALSSHVPTTFLDSVMQQAWWSETEDSVYNVVNSAVASYSAEFNQNIKTLFAKYQNDVKSALDSYNSSIGSIVGASDTESNLTIANSDLTSVMSTNDSVIQSKYDSASSQFADRVTSIHSRVKFLFDGYKSQFPLIRLTGSFNIPKYLSTSENTEFSFAVINSSGVAWRGWFGVVIEDSSGHSYPYNARKNIIDLAPKESKQVVLSVPTGAIFSENPIGSSASVRILVNTLTSIEEM